MTTESHTTACPGGGAESSWRQGALRLEERTPPPWESLGLRKRDGLADQPVLGGEGLGHSGLLCGPEDFELYPDGSDNKQSGGEV